jgi:hypothetical protein
MRVGAAKVVLFHVRQLPLDRVRIPSPHLVEQRRGGRPKARSVLIATSLAVAMPCFALRVISGDFEHLYGPGGQSLDDADLRACNHRVWEHMQAEKQRASGVDIEEERLKFQEAALPMEWLRVRTERLRIGTQQPLATGGTAAGLSAPPKASDRE